MNSSKSQPIIKTNMIFAIVCLFVTLLTGSYLVSVLVENHTLKKDGIQVDAKVTDITTYTYSDSDGDKHTGHDVIVNFTVDGKEYEITLNKYGKASKGNLIKLYYYPDEDPGYAKALKRTSDIWLVYVTVIVFGGVGIGFTRSVIRSILKRRLISTGISVMADITYCGVSTVRINKRPTYIVEGKWTDEYGISHQYISECVMTNPQEDLQDGKVEVFLNPKNYDKYYVNI